MEQQCSRRACASCSAPRRAAGFALAVAICFSIALLTAQTLGLLHGILHNAGTTMAVAASGADVPLSHSNSVEPDGRRAPGGDGMRGHSGAAGFLAHLFSDHLVSADCRAYDQLSHLDAAPGVAAVVLPLVLTPFLLSTLTGLATARWHALFQARGPPSLR